MQLKIIYEDIDLIVVDKPSGIIVFSEKKIKQKTIIDLLLKQYPKLKNIGKSLRYGLIHRLDKDTSGILLIAKNNQSLIFFQKQFQLKKVVKKYIALVIGKIKKNKGKIETIIERSPKNRKKQKVYLSGEPLPKKENLRKAVTEYRVLKKFKNYTLVEVCPKTGRKHQIRCHFAYLSHPIVGDIMYGFKNQPCPQNLKRQFLHANYLKIKLPDGKTKVFKSNLPNDLKKVLSTFK